MAKRYPVTADVSSAATATRERAVQRALGCEDGKLPPGWAMAAMGEIASVQLGKMLDRTKHTTGESVPYLRNVNVRWGSIETRDLQKMFFESDEIERYALRKGDLVVCEGGEPGRAGIWDREEPVMYQKALHRVRPGPAVLAEWILVGLRRHAAAGSLDSFIGGTTIRHLTRESFVRLPLALPPVPEQRRIVARLDALEAHSHRAREALDALLPLLAKARQSLLATAFRGTLTAEWRDANSKAFATDEPSPDEDAETAWPIPDGWKATRVNNLIPKGGLFDGPFGSHLKSDDYTAEGARVVRLENIGHLQFDDEKRTFVSLEKFEKLKRHTVMGGDIIFASFISEPLRVCILPSLDTPAIAKADCFCARPNEQLVDRAYLCYQLACPGIGHQLADLVHGATRPRINTTQLREVPVAWCPLAEQREIVRRLKTALARLDAAAAAHAAAVAELDRLDAALLVKAFRGALVPQDPADEPAAVTLQRLRTPREVFDPFAYLFQFIPALLRASEGALPFARALEGCALLRVPRDLVRLLEPIAGAPARQHFERFAQPLNDGSFEPVLQKLIAAGAITYDQRANHMLRLVESKVPPIASLISEDAAYVARVLALVPTDALETLIPKHSRKLFPNPTFAMVTI